MSRAVSFALLAQVLRVFVFFLNFVVEFVCSYNRSFMHYLLMYDVVNDYVERRASLRSAHITLAREAVERGELVLGGALNPPEGVMLLFRGDSPAAAEAFAKADPYVQNGLVKGWKVREWTTVVGRDAEVKLPPGV
jgi:uncharacterized protein